jgi:hypothetical protein
MLDAVRNALRLLDLRRRPLHWDPGVHRLAAHPGSWRQLALGELFQPISCLDS